MSDHNQAEGARGEEHWHFCMPLQIYVAVVDSLRSCHPPPATVEVAR